MISGPYRDNLSCSVGCLFTLIVSSEMNILNFDTIFFPSVACYSFKRLSQGNSPPSQDSLVKVTTPETQNITVFRYRSLTWKFRSPKILRVGPDPV